MKDKERYLCDACGLHQANVVYYAEVKCPKSYKPKLEGLAICRKCDKAMSESIL